MSEPVIRLTRPNDMNILTRLDLKTHHYPLSMEEWQKRIKGSGKAGEARVVVCEVLNKVAGFAMWSIDKDHEVARILRIGVLPKFRSNNLGRLLIRTCVQHAYDQKCEKVSITVPHLHCCPGDPDDVSVFLDKCKFEPSGEVLHDWRMMYGQTVDGYVFERQLHVTAPGL